MKKIIVVDIDGTIAKVNPERLKFIQQDRKDWDGFYEMCFKDEPYKDICSLVTDFYKLGYHILFCTGRRESVRNETIAWIKSNIPINGDFNLIMRPNEDKRHDTECKPEQLASYQIRNYGSIGKVHIILEDRNSMVKKWRELGFRCLQVQDGDF